MLDPTTPLAARLTLIGALAYFVTPFDFVPDFILGLGFVDDASILMAAITAVRSSINEEHRVAARRALAEEADAPVEAGLSHSLAHFLGRIRAEPAGAGIRRGVRVDGLVTKARKSAAAT